MGDASAQNAIAAVCEKVAEACSSNGSPAVPAKWQVHRLRCLAAFLRAGLLQDVPQLKGIGETMRRVLGDVRTPVPVRAQAWIVHAEACFKSSYTVEFRVSIRSRGSFQRLRSGTGTIL